MAAFFPQFARQFMNIVMPKSPAQSRGLEYWHIERIEPVVAMAAVCMVNMGSPRAYI